MSPAENSRHIPEPIQRLLWGRAAARCEFAGCNKPLWKSSVTQEPVNIAQKAHVRAFSPHGPRGACPSVPSGRNELSNLMLLCHECHRKIDSDPDGGRYSAELLQKMKARHERRIEIAAGVHEDRRSHILLYGANIGAHNSPLSFASTAPALFPQRYPADEKALRLGMVNSSLNERDRHFWVAEQDHLIRMFSQEVRARLRDGTIEHLSVFALAPQPLLVLFGSLLTDIPRVDLYQRRREPQGWDWLESEEPAGMMFKRSGSAKGRPALVLSFSGTITQDRVNAVLGQDVDMWHMTIPTPNNDFLKSRKQLREFRELIRLAMDRIKTQHGQDALLHVFPAAPAAIAVELGRIHMPKADLRMRVYDQIAGQGFVPTIDIPVENQP